MSDDRHKKETLTVTIHVITVRSAAVNKPVGVEFNVIEIGCILFFRMSNIRTENLTTKKSIPKIFRNVFNYRQTLFTASDILGQRP